MLERLFHAWERRLVSVTRDRVVRPFDWGLDWIPLNGHRASAEPVAVLADWVSQVMKDTDDFFTPPPIDHYAVTGIENGERLVSFPSALTTPHRENNTAYCRYFPAVRKRRAATPRAAVLVLPQWNADAEGHVGLCRILNWAGL